MPSSDHSDHAKRPTPKRRVASNVDEELEDLARRAKDGDEAAMDDLLRRIQPEVLRRCSRFLPYRQDAEEACQDALLRVARKIGSFKGDSLFTTWLYTVVSNSARQTYRSMKRRSAEYPTEAERMPNQSDPRTTSVIAGSRIDLLEALDQLEKDCSQPGGAARPAGPVPDGLQRDRLGAEPGSGHRQIPHSPGPQTRAEVLDCLVTSQGELLWTHPHRHVQDLGVPSLIQL